MSGRAARVRVPVDFPVERVVVGELHLLRGRLDETLVGLAGLIARAEEGEQWLRAEEAARLARRALAAAVAATPPLAAVRAQIGGVRVVGELRVDPAARRQWYGEREFDLSPLHHRLLARLADDPYRVFAKDELLRDVWGGCGQGSNAVKTSVSRLRRALVGAGAPPGAFLLSLHGIGWALTRPDRG